MRVKAGVSYGELTSLPGTSQIVVSHDVFIPPSQRGAGAGTLAHAVRCQMMRDLGYDYALCAINGANTPQVRILDKAGWRVLDAFQSTKTEHQVVIYGRVL